MKTTKRYRSRGEIAQTKLEMLDIYLANKNISDADMARALNLDAHTVAKWKAEWAEKLGTVKHEIEGKIVEQIEKQDGLWQKLTNLFK